MSDQSTPPPKPKPGSLRDRIAAFEKPAAGPAPGPAPAPRPKPGGISWKPKVPSPPSSPSSADVSAPSERKVGGMSASDAKESIGKGGSLKERMAALQNRGGFGVPPPVAPKPALEKPKWKPPPVVAPVDKDEDDLPRGEPLKSPPAPSVRTSEDDTAKEAADEELSPKGDEGEQVENDEEEEERQRRAAIAARMARLGGARVGVAPVFGKPAVKRPEPKEEPAPIASSKDEVEEVVSEPTNTNDDIPEPSPPTGTTAGERPSGSSDVEPIPERPTTERKTSEAASLASLDTETQSSRSPSSMPLPSAPRRTAPPRKKAAKPPTPATPILGEENVEPPEVAPTLEPAIASDEALATVVDDQDQVKGEVGDRQRGIGEIDKTEVEPSKDETETSSKVVADALVIEDDQKEGPTASSAHATEKRKESLEQDSTEDDEITKTSQPETKSNDVTPPVHSTDLPVDVEYERELSARDIQPELEPSPEDSKTPDVVNVHEKTIVEEPAAIAAQVDDEDEEAEAARRKRLAEKFAKMGGVNPLAPPQRKPSLLSEGSQSSPTSPTLPKRTSISRESIGSPPPPLRRDSLRKSSIDSHVSLEGNVPQSSSVPSPPPRKSSVGSPVEHVSESPLRRGSQDDSHSEPSVPTIATKAIPEESEERSDIGELPEESERHQESRKTSGGKLTISGTGGRHSGEEKYEKPLLDKDDLEIPPTPTLTIPPPHVPPRSTRPVARQEAPVDPALAVDPVPVPPRSLPQVPSHIASPPVRTVPPPPQFVSELNEAEGASDSESENFLGQSIQALPVSQQVSDNEENDSPRPIPPRLGPSEDNTDNEAAPLPVPHRRSLSLDKNTRPTASYATSRPLRSIPIPPAISTPTSDVESDYDEVLPTRPRHRPMTPGTPPPNEVPLIVPPPASEDTTKKPDPSPLRQSAFPPHSQTDSSPIPPEVSPTHLTPTLSVSEQEILDEEEGDPIDPAFYSPSRRASTIGLPPVASPPPTEPSADSEEDTEQARRRTIAERMAKLGGIKFGAAPIPASIGRPPPPAPRRDSVETSGDAIEEHVDPTEEEEERARKERIAAKLAGMGGMRIGMMPLGVGGLRPQQSHVLKEESIPESEPESDLTTSIPALPTRALPPSRPPPPPTQSQDSDVDLSNSQYSLSASEDGVKVEAEESELEEVSHVDAEELEEAPPPVPSRTVRRGMSVSEPTQPPPVPVTRPPIPTSVPSRKSSVLTTASTTRKSSVDSPVSPRRPSVPKPHSEYVMVEEPKGFTEDNDIPPPPPPHRPTGRAPPSRSAPPPPDPADSISSQWELPSIPTSSLEFGQDADLSLSWTEDPIPERTSPSPPPPPPPPHRETDRRVSQAPPAERQLSPDDLIAVWGRVGVQICEVATLLFEKSKKSLVGDGTYGGFVHAVLNEVPNAAPASSDSYGYLIYSQTGGAVQKRASEIMPGDIVELLDAKLKGHKGIHAYNQSVGAGEPLVGVISEFEPKKSKIRVFQANQHVGQQTVEAASYRLDDLKSGTIKVFRVLEAE
ncbi:hypothetical protein BDZ94DRAFT_1254292 [Collybia nuda]|uniref:BBC1/AIM3 cysteine proteinase-fold domain-containing protein n=1 Tax=Collybia nuda TaxID=64659 RepID=A0A9P5YBE6_9AGAR|nr:hypothetical protein BDZ94DRAFT_1254292 [Collybia nuda]